MVRVGVSGLWAWVRCWFWDHRSSQIYTDLFTWVGDCWSDSSENEWGGFRGRGVWLVGWVRCRFWNHRSLRIYRDLSWVGRLGSLDVLWMMGTFVGFLVSCSFEMSMRISWRRQVGDWTAATRFAVSSFQGGRMKMAELTCVVVWRRSLVAFA